MWCVWCRRPPWLQSGTGQAMLRPSSTPSRGVYRCRVSTSILSTVTGTHEESFVYMLIINKYKHILIVNVLVSCLTGLSRELEELMVEGLLLQVSLPEVQSLYHKLLDRAASQLTNRCTLPPQDEAADADTHTQFNSQGTNLPLNQVKTTRINENSKEPTTQQPQTQL